MRREVGGTLPVPLTKDGLTPAWFTAAFRESGLIPRDANVRVGGCMVSYLSGDPADPSNGGFTGNELLQATLSYTSAALGDDDSECALATKQLAESLELPHSVAIKKFDLTEYFAADHSNRPQGMCATFG